MTGLDDPIDESVRGSEQLFGVGLALTGQLFAQCGIEQRFGGPGEISRAFKPQTATSEMGMLSGLTVVGNDHRGSEEEGLDDVTSE